MHPSRHNTHPQGWTAEQYHNQATDQQTPNRLRPALEASRSLALLVRGPLPFPPEFEWIIRREFSSIETLSVSQCLELSNFSRFEFVFVMAGMKRSVLDSADRIVGHVNCWRFLQARRRWPELIVVTAARIEDSVVADFENRVCHVLVYSPDQIRQRIGSLRVHRTRQYHRGFHVQLIEIGRSRSLFLVGRNGHRAELTHNARRIRLILMLSSERRPFGDDELARRLGWSVGQVRVYIGRLRKDFEDARKTLGISASSSEFIESTGKGSGWYLHAWVQSRKRESESCRSGA